MKNTLAILFLSALLFGLQVPTLLGNDLTPRKDWRLKALAIQANDQQAAIEEALTSGKDFFQKADFEEDGSFSLSIHLPPMPKPGMLVFSMHDAYRTMGVEKMEATLTPSLQDSNGEPANITFFSTRQKDINGFPSSNSYRLHKVDIPAGPSRWLQLNIKIITQKRSYVTNLGLYELDPQGKNDYWLSIGASIQAGGIRYDSFKQAIQEKYGFDPVMFNTSTGGWETSSWLRKGFLNKLLADHPYATFCAIHIGGNNVSKNRPFGSNPDQDKQFAAELEEIVQIIQNAGKVPVISRISFRDYKPSSKHDKPIVDGGKQEENGSLPYNVEIVDPLIARMTPRFYDNDKNQGAVDAYTYFRENQNYLSKDGVHNNIEGQRAWNDFWAQSAGSIIYSD